MRSSRAVLLCCVLLCADMAAAADPVPAPPANPPGADGNTRPERQLRPLPADTFTPSEEISEDFPVPFPVDI